MSERFTAIYLRQHDGTRTLKLCERGVLTVAQMIAKYREYAHQEYVQAKAILDAVDSAFVVETFRGLHVEREREVLQDGNVETTTN